MIKNKISNGVNNRIIIDEYEFEDIATEFINCEEYMLLLNENHHGIERLRHAFKVAKATYKISKLLGLDYKSATRAALLHDFFFDKQFDKSNNFVNKSKTHPEYALENSRRCFNINEIEADAILNHMYPLTPNKPESMEGITLSLVDKGIAITDWISSFYNKGITKKKLEYIQVKENIKVLKYQEKLTSRQ